MKKISFVIPCYRSTNTIESVVTEIQDTMKSCIDYNYEIILINDCSPDDTFETIVRISKNNKNVIGLNLSKNFGQHAALMAGFNHCTGDIVVCLDDDGQTPADEALKLINKIEDGYDIVYASYENKKHSWFRNLGSKFNSKMTEILLGKPKDIYVSSYFAVKKFVIDQVIQYKNSYPYVIGLVLRTSNKIANVEVKHRERNVGNSGYTFSKLLKLWINGFTAFSVKPLRIATFTGVLMALCGFAYALFIVINKIIDPSVPAGWSSTISALMLIGGIIMCMLGMIGEYIGRIYISLNNAPQYVVGETTIDKDDKKED